MALPTKKPKSAAMLSTDSRRQELREMHQGVMEDGLLPESGEVRGVMAQMEALLELLEGKSSRKAKAESS